MKKFGIDNEILTYVVRDAVLRKCNVDMFEQDIQDTLSDYLDMRIPYNKNTQQYNAIYMSAMLSLVITLQRNNQWQKIRDHTKWTSIYPVAQCYFISNKYEGYIRVLTMELLCVLDEWEQRRYHGKE